MFKASPLVSHSDVKNFVCLGQKEVFVATLSGEIYEGSQFSMTEV